MNLHQSTIFEFLSFLRLCQNSILSKSAFKLFNVAIYFNSIFEKVFPGIHYSQVSHKTKLLRTNIGNGELFHQKREFQNKIKANFRSLCLKNATLFLLPTVFLEQRKC